MMTRRLTGLMPSPNLMSLVRRTALISLVLTATLLSAREALAVETNTGASIAELTAIRVANHTRYQRVVIDTSAAVSFAVVEGKHPLTLVVHDATAKPHSLAWTDLGLLKGATVTTANDKSVYISFDVTANVRPRISSYTPDSYGGHRIVIDLWPVKEPEAKPEPQRAYETDRISELTVGALDHQPTADMTSGLDSGAFWPDLGSNGEDDDDEDLMQVPGLKVTQQWPDLLAEAARTIRENENALAFPPENAGPPAHDVPENVAGLALKPALAPLVPSPTTDPISAARRSLAQGQPGDACKVLQVNYPKGTWNIEAMVLQGACLSALGKLIDANTLYTEVLSFDPNNVDARLGLAKAQAEAGDLTAARDNYTRALENTAVGERTDTVQRQLQAVEDKIKHAIH